MSKSHLAATIVIPTFNRAELLPFAIDSALSQSVSCEVIVVDHGSTDGTYAAVARYGDRIKYIHRDKDFGPHFCWLEGVLSATTDLVHLQFDDDWIEPTFIESCLSVIGPNVGFAFCSAHILKHATSEIIRTQFSGWLPATGVYKKSRLEKKILSTLISPACALYRKQILLDSLYQGRLPLATAEYKGVGPDCLVTLLSMLRYDAIGYVKEPLAIFRAHDGSITVDASENPVKERQIKRAYTEVKRYYREMKLLKFLRKVRGWN